MNARKVVVTMEVETDARLRDLKDSNLWDFNMGWTVFVIDQIQVNVGKEEKKKK